VNRINLDDVCHHGHPIPDMPMRSSDVRKILSALAVCGGLAATTVVAHPAQAAAQWPHRIQNVATYQCLAASTGRQVYQAPCSNGPASVLNSWVISTESGNNQRVRHEHTNRCLDTDGTKVYLSPCSAADPGQKWDQMDHGSRWRAFNGEFLTAWNAGPVTVADLEDMDNLEKGVWSPRV
jgi:hypothetical protein